LADAEKGSQQAAAVLAKTRGDKSRVQRIDRDSAAFQPARQLVSEI